MIADFLYKNDKSLCCGCRGCEQACALDAIIMKYDDEGFIYPSIIKEKCVDCNVCKNVCPINNSYISTKSEFEKPIVYAAWANNEDVRIDSSSGGLFSVIAEQIINENGIVYGAAFDKDLKVIYQSASTYNEILPLRVSKYVQSNTLKCFSEIKEYLGTDKRVLFVGTPCYVAGLKTFLKKDHYNLLTVDLICQGVPSQKLFDKYIAHLRSKYNGEIEKFRFRDKSDCWGQNPSTSFAVRKKSGKIKRKIFPLNLASYFYGFLQYKTQRPSCYECQFRTLNRIADITLADYWGVKNFHTDMDFNKGVSALIIHSQKGKEIIEALKDKIEKVDSTIENAARHNVNMNKKSIKPEIRNIIYENIDKMDYKEIEKKYFRPENYYFAVFQAFICKHKRKIKNAINMIKPFNSFS